MGRVPGPFGSSHASVHSVRSWRAGLPVRARERTVSPEPAASSFRVTAGECMSASVTVSQTDPSHTPWAPRLRAAATCCPLPMPPAARTGNGPTASTTSGVRTIEAISPVCPPAS